MRPWRRPYWAPLMPCVKAMPSNATVPPTRICSNKSWPHVCLPPKGRATFVTVHGSMPSPNTNASVVDQALINAMVSTNIPSNGIDFDEWHAQHLLDPNDSCTYTHTLHDISPRAAMVL
eukprot:scaffold11552_cov50-Attheya_sp.AAC.9